MKMVPLYNKSLVEIIPEDTETKTPSGLIIQAKKPNIYLKGKVLSVGKGHYQNGIRIPMDVVEGQIIYFLRNSGMGVDFDLAGNATKILLADTDIYAVEEND